MLLIERRLPARAAAPASALALLLAAPLIFAACSVRYDESYDKRALREEANGWPTVAAEDVDAAVRNGALSADDGVRTNTPLLFGLRYDDRPEMGRLARAAQHNDRDPRLQPSYRELREARSSKMIEADILANGGNTHVRYDGSSSKPAEVGFVAAPGALAMLVEASDNLNAVDGNPNALVLVVYHLSDRLAIDQLARTEDGMRKLLEGEMFDASVKSVRQLTLQPGVCNRLEMDRAERGRYVALVAGYNRPDHRTSLFVTSYNIGQYKKSAELRLFSEVDMYMPLPLNLHVSLGEKSMLVSETGQIYHNHRESTRLLRQQKYHYKTPTWQLRRR